MLIVGSVYASTKVKHTRWTIPCYCMRVAHFGTADHAREIEPDTYPSDLHIIHKATDIIIIAVPMYPYSCPYIVASATLGRPV